MTSHDSTPIESTDIAIIGMAARFPGARDLDEFWELVVSGRSAFSHLTDEQLRAAGVPGELRSHPDYVPVAGVLEDVDCFDAEFFEIGPRDAALMDPQHRHFLEVCWEALEDAGHMPSRFDGSIGVYAGSGMNGYLVHNILPNRELVDPLGLFAVRHTSNDKDFLSTGVSYRLNLRGPSVNVQTACSTSLVSLHLAVQALIAGECDMALAGGVTIEAPHGQGYLYRDGEILAKDGVCRAFDAASSGTVLTSGAGVVVVRRLSDALADGDHVYAVVKATAINNDGAGKVGYLAPSVDGHAAVVAEAQELAGITADTVQYVEAHGTGTPVGDPIEVAALTQAFRRSTQATGFARIGSTKPSIGHLDTAAGVASVIKTALALTNRTLPPMAGYTGENPLLDLETTPFVLSPEPSAWPRLSTPRRAGISSLGVGGTNAHAILDEGPSRVDADNSGHTTGRYELLPLSAKTPAALERSRKRLADYLEHHPELRLSDVAFTLQEGREPFAQRDVVAARSTGEAVAKLRAPRQSMEAGRPPSVVFMFPGGGAQYPNMGRELYETEPAHRAAADRCFNALEPALRSAVRELLFPPAGMEESAAEQLAMPSVQLPAIFLTEYALAQLWLSWGITPDAMTGHSLGEYVAACIAGVFSVEDAMRVVALRGQIMERCRDAAMLSVALPEPALTPMLRPGISLAAVNAPGLCLVSGAAGPIAELESQLGANDVISRRLRFNGAVHCSLLDPHLEEFARCLRSITMSVPRLRYISNVTGGWIEPDEACSVEYWVHHLRHTVRFADGLSTLLEDPNRVLVELGPGNTLCTLVKQQPERPVAAFPSLPHPAEERRADDAAVSAFGRLWTTGVAIDWNQGERATVQPRRVSLPPYQFERTRHWFDAPTNSGASGPLRLPPEEWGFRPAWRRSDLTGKAGEVAETETWLVVGAGRLTKRVSADLRARGADVVNVRPGSAFGRRGAWDYSVTVDDEKGWAEIAAQLSAFRQNVTGILWLIPLEQGASPASTFFGPVALLQQLHAAGHRPASLTIASSGAYSVDDEPVTQPLGALAEGPVRVAPSEFESLTARLVDIGDSGGDEAASSLVAEALIGTEPLVAFRNGRRWVRSTEPLRLPAHDKASKFDWGRSVLVTGGLGGVGLSLAGWLASTGQGRQLTLVSRSGLPPRAEWDLLASASGTLGETIRAIQGLERKGAEVFICTADVANPGEVTAAMAAALQRFGAIDTVFHAAGLVDDAPIATRSREDMAAVLRPKVEGTDAVLEAARSGKVSTVVLCSSVSGELGLPGQVDYVGANAYLNAIADAWRTGSMRVVSMPFGRWDEVGMASVQRPIGDGQPFLGKQTHSGGAVRFDSTKLAEELWVLDGHRLPSRVAVMPGTGFLQLLVSAARRATGTQATVFERVEFSEALPAHNGVPVTFTTSSVGGSLTVRSRQTVHASAQLADEGRSQDVPPTWNWDSQPFESAGKPSFQDSQLLFGPRWNALRALERSGRRTFATVALQDEFLGDLDGYDLHPALLDIALSCGVPPGFLLAETVVAPVRCDRFEALKPLPGRMRVIVEQLDSQDSAEVRFDVYILDETGTDVVVRASGMTYRRLPAESVARISVAASRTVKPLIPYGSGLTPSEAWPVVEHVLGLGVPVGGVSTIGVEDLKRLAARSQSAPAAGALLARPVLASVFEEPRSEVESALCRIWAECLGIDGIGIHDDFFELGGHSLIALRVISRIQESFGRKFLLTDIQERPTVGSLAELLAGAGPITTDEATSPDGETGESILVVMRRSGTRTPFFCVHGMFGNVMNFTDLAKAGPEDRPFVAIQQHGLNGGPAPYLTIEAMAAAYIAEVRQYQPQGPYALGGYSAGGCIALEMARQLTAAGETVSHVVMLDSWGPAMVGRTPSLRFSRMLRRLRFEGPRFVSRKVRFTLNAMRPKQSEQVLLRNAPGEKKVFADVELGNVVVDALHNYTFTGVDVPVTLVAAGLREPETRFLPADLGWRGILPHLKIRTVPTPHITMCTGVNAARVAQAITDALDS